MILGDCSQTKQTKETVSGGRNLEPQPADRTKEIDKKIIERHMKDTKRVNRHYWLNSFILMDFWCQSAVLATVFRAIASPLKSLVMTFLGRRGWATGRTGFLGWQVRLCKERMSVEDLSCLKKGMLVQRRFCGVHPEQPNSGCLSSLSYMLRLASALWPMMETALHLVLDIWLVDQEP